MRNAGEPSRRDRVQPGDVVVRYGAKYIVREVDGDGNVVRAEGWELRERNAGERTRGLVIHKTIAPAEDVRRRLHEIRDKADLLRRKQDRTKPARNGKADKAKKRESEIRAAVRRELRFRPNASAEEIAAKLSHDRDHPVGRNFVSRILRELRGSSGRVAPL